ncbi:MAG: CBS domain-containing protein [Anaerostipes sp.]|jgi:CBS domain-containing protein|nr:CBS domain-containing protein [Anaerostipes sp.]MDD3745170.1 CBS domain-containing protein [Anaerostipes sp.]
MNVLFFLTPKKEVSCLREDYTLRQALEKMQAHGYTAVPILSKDGKYIGTVTEGDILWYVKDDYNLDIKSASDVKLTDIKRRRDNKAISVNNMMDDLVDIIKVQNFVPVIDDKESFIGIVTRKDVIEYYYEEYKNSEQR